MPKVNSSWRQRSAAGSWAAVLVACAIVGGCAASPPSPGPGSGITPGTGRYVTLATCQGPAACPGVGCASHAQGVPDQQVVDLASCGVLDLVWTGGTIVARQGSADLAFHLGRVDPGAGARIEASADGTSYVVVGFINRAPAEAHPSCIATQADSRALLSLARPSINGSSVAGCVPLANVSFVRLSALQRGGPTLELDAVEALEGSFQPRS